MGGVTWRERTGSAEGGVFNALIVILSAAKNPVCAYRSLRLSCTGFFTTFTMTKEKGTGFEGAPWPGFGFAKPLARIGVKGVSARIYFP